MMRTISSGIDGSISSMGRGSSVMILKISPVMDSPRKAFWPVSISYRMAPTAKRSLRPSSAVPRACSGLM